MKDRRIHKRPPLGRDRGFTLLEVLLAFLVFALSFAAVLEILSGSIRNTVRAREYTEAALIAQSVMGQVGLDIPLESGGGGSGESGNYNWELTVENYEASSDTEHSVQLAELTGIELLEVELVISTGQASRERSYEFSTVKALLVNRRAQ